MATEETPAAIAAPAVASAAVAPTAAPAPKLPIPCSPTGEPDITPDKSDGTLFVSNRRVIDTTKITASSTISTEPERSF